MITRTNIGLELHLVSLTQFLHSKTSWRRGYNKRGKGPFHHTMGNDAMSKALWQISRSPFVRRINKARLLYRFSQPMFTIYNGGLIPWSMSVTLIRRWPSMPTTRPLCARCSLPTLGPSPCVGLMLCRRDQLGPLKSWDRHLVLDS